ncbi:MAG TPA: kelch repeat-containing protein, partial [Acidimicrobiales bacterium]|nr:kelch repeat-containing protein [Acidimicrobiales bacterium]
EMAEGRTNHAAALLDDGSVLVAGGAGGENADISLASVEVLNPRQGGWATVASLAEARTGHTATRLDDGRVLVAGGESARRGSRRSLASAEVFAPQATSGGEWRPAGDMGCPRSEHAAVLLDDGSVLAVAGDAAFPGQAPAAQSCVARYRP